MDLGIAQAADLSVGGWATLGSITPAARCWVDPSVEVRQDGGGVSDVAVSVNLVHHGEVFSSDWGMTDGDGLAFMGVETSWAAPGYEAWLGVLVGGEYAGGPPVSVTDPGIVDVGVPTYAQRWNVSREYATLLIAVGAYGIWVSEYEFDNRVGWSENPHWGYRGDITGWWGNTDDYGVYAAALAPAFNGFGF